MPAGGESAPATPRRSRRRHRNRRRSRPFAARDGVGDPAGGLAHARKHMRIGHLALDRRIEECVDRVHVDVAAGKDARKQFGNFVTLRDRERPGGPALVEPVAPCSSRSPNARRRGSGRCSSPKCRAVQNPSDQRN